MLWICPECNNPENHEQAVRCACGYEIVDDTPTDYSKLGGALYLVLAGLLINICVSAINLYSWLGTGAGAADTQILVQISLNAVLLLCSGVLLFFMLKKSKTFPAMMITFLALNILFAIGSYQIIKAAPTLPNYYDQLNAAIDRAVINTIVGAAWIAYFVRSERVRKTFVN